MATLAANVMHRLDLSEHELLLLLFQRFELHVFCHKMLPSLLSEHEHRHAKRALSDPFDLGVALLFHRWIAGRGAALLSVTHEHVVRCLERALRSQHGRFSARATPSDHTAASG